MSAMRPDVQHAAPLTWRDLASHFLLSRAVIALIGFVGVGMFVDQHTLTIGGALAFNPEVVWNKWDAVWYERIARFGYGYQVEDLKGQAAAGFFPLYPLTVGVLMKVVPFLSFFWVATIFSNLVTLVALWLVARAEPTPALARRVLLVICTAAGSFYLSIPYAESLYLLLIVLTLILTRRQMYVLAGLAAGLAFAARLHGLVAVAIPVVACWLDARLPLKTRLMRIALIGIVFAIPMGIHMIYLADVQGSADAFIARQSMWDNAFPYPLKAIVGFIEFPKRTQGWLHGLFWFVYVALIVRYWKQMPLGEALFCLAAMLVSTQQEAFHGIYRYVVPLVPIASCLARDRDDLQLALIGFNLVFGTLMILAFVTNNRLAV